MSDEATRLAQVRAWYENALLGPAWQTWCREAREAWDFYDGDQWSAGERTRLEEMGQPAIVINKLASRVDNLAGGEVAGRTQIIFRSRSGSAPDERAAQILTDLALYVAERSEQALAVSEVFRAGMVAGIGWLDVGVAAVSVDGAQVFCRAEDEFSVVWDPMSRRADMSDARFVCRGRWLDEGQVNGLFPGQAEQLLRALKQGGLPGQSYAGPAYAPRGDRADSVSYYRADSDLYRVVEVQYLVPAKQWTLRHDDGTLAVTWERKLAEGPGVTVESADMVPRARVAYFAGEVLLSDDWLPYRHNRFTLVPYVYKRQRMDGRPYGLIRAAMDPQRELNKRRSKAMHLLNTAQVIADVDAVDDPALLAREAARPDGLILKRAGKELTIHRNIDLAQSQVAVMLQAGKDIQDVLGLFDENLGKPSNAVSGVAIQQRQLAGSLNQMFAFDALRLLKKRLGEQVLGLVRQYFNAEMVVKITDDLDAVREAGLPLGKAAAESLLFDGDFDVVVEEVPDVLSTRELEIQRLDMLLKAGVPIPPEVLVEASGVGHKERILAALAPQPAPRPLQPNKGER
jgi:hypothetical protein